MARIAPAQGRNPFLRLLDWGSRRRYGREFAPLAVMAHNPRFLLPYVGMNAFASGKTRLSPEIRILAMHLVAERNGCTWCIDFGRSEGRKLGVPDEKLAAVPEYETSSLFSPPERAALAFAGEATDLGVRVSDETFRRLREHFSEREIVELTAAVAAEKFFNTFNTSLEIEAQGFCAVPGAAARPDERAV